MNPAVVVYSYCSTLEPWSFWWVAFGCYINSALLLPPFLVAGVAGWIVRRLK